MLLPGLWSVPTNMNSLTRKENPKVTAGSIKERGGDVNGTESAQPSWSCALFGATSEKTGSSEVQFNTSC